MPPFALYFNDFAETAMILFFNVLKNDPLMSNTIFTVVICCVLIKCQ